MASNNILINYVLSYEVDDKDIPQLMEWLENNGQKTDVLTNEAAICSQQPS